VGFQCTGSNRPTRIEPNWGLYDDFCINHVDEALTMDQKPSSHPIEVPLDNPDDVNQVRLDTKRPSHDADRF
jgi:hypothetical protein